MMTNIHTKEAFKISFKYSLIFILFTGFLKKSIFIVFNIQNILDIKPVFNLFFDTFTHMIIFIIILILAHNKYKKNKASPFYGILTLTILIILFTYILKYFNDLFFYNLNELIHKPTEQKTNSFGLLSLIDDITSTFDNGRFSPIYDLISSPLHGIQVSIKLLNFNIFILAVLNSKVIISIIVMYYESLFALFKRLNKPGYNALIPIKNNLILLKITRKPLWWIIPISLPFIKFIPKYYMNLAIAKKFNRINAFAIGMTFISFYFYGLISFNDFKVNHN